MFVLFLGLGTKPGVLTPSDADPTTFWITSPLTTLTNNAAAGSHNKAGVGIWYVFPDEPVGPSTGLGFLGYLEAKHTPITLFENNSAHSNGNAGLGFFNRVGTEHQLIGCSTYSPRVNPQDQDSEFQAVILNGFTGFKNRKRNVKMRSTASELINFRLADSQTGIELDRNMLGGYQRVSDSVIVGESPNFGIGGKFKLNGMNANYYRSLPNPWNMDVQNKPVRRKQEHPHLIQRFLLHLPTFCRF